MPIVHIYIRSGRTPEKKEELIEKVTDVIVETLQVSSRDNVHILLHDMAPENIGHGGIPRSKAKA